MNAHVRVRLAPNGRWRGGMLTDEVRGWPPGVPVVIQRGRQRGPDKVDCVRVSENCPVELFDAAVESGYYVVGLPRRATK